MASSNYLDSPFGGADTRKFTVGGLDELYLINKEFIQGFTDVKDAFGATLEVTAIQLVTGKTFQEIEFKEQSASYTDAFKYATGGNKNMAQGVNFSIDAAGSEALEKSHQIQLARRTVALVKTKKGEYKILGLSLGLVCTDTKADSGAKYDDVSTLEFTLSGVNLGHAPVVTLDATEFAALVTRVA